MPKPAAALPVSAEQLGELRTWLGSSSIPAGLAQRARIITLAAEGVANTEIAELAGCSRQTVITWRQRFAQHGPDGSATGRVRAAHVPSTCTRSWRSSPPRSPGLAERRTPDYIRHGTTTLFAALEVATGKVTDRCFARQRHTEFLAFCKQVAKAYPRRELHIVLDNYCTHRHPRVRTWLARNPRIRLHFTPTSASWMNLVEVFFGIITRQAIRRGAFTSVADLVQAIRVFIDAWNHRCQPFSWTRTPQPILAKARP